MAGNAGAARKNGGFGGPHEVLADVYAFTGEKKYLKLAEKFRHNIVFEPMLHGDSMFLNKHHANTEIPKFIGYERIYQLTGDMQWHNAARFFWEEVALHRTWANGGTSQWEHFFNPAHNEAKVNETCGPETCCPYNMLKLTQQLYTRQPHAAYIDYCEQALYNSILPSLAPGGGFVYYTSMRPGNFRRFSRPFDAFWCDVGTGMENHGKYGEMIYAADKQQLYINLFIPSVLTWKDMVVRQETTFPAETRTQITLELKQNRRFTLSLRQPAWAKAQKVIIMVNHQPVSAPANADGYWRITRLWKSGDCVEMSLPMQITARRLPHSPDHAAFFYGPVLLAGLLGTDGLERSDFYEGGNNTDAANQLAAKPLPLTDVPTF